MPPPPQNTVQESWTAEPELKDKPPRRIAPSEYPDLNQTNVMLFLIIGGVAVASGLVLLILGLAGAAKSVGMILGGIVLALGGTALLVVFPQKQKAHLARAENLVTNGIPVAARVLSSDNMTGDSTYGRSVKYQVTLPGGEMAHRSVNADERALPKRIPGDTTALIDVDSGDVELYCALPFRAVSKNPSAVPVGVPADPFGTTIPTMAPTAAPTMASTAPVTTPANGQYGDRLPSSTVPSAPPTGGGALGDRLPSPGSKETPAPEATPAMPVTDRMGTIIAPPPTVTDREDEPAPGVEKAPPTSKEPEAAPQTWE